MVIIGIDLGTTNSACGVWQDGAVKLIPNALGEYLTPSVVGIDDDGSVLVGQSAKQRLVSHPSKTVAYFKRLMGTQKKIALSKQHTFDAVELSSLVLRSLKRDAEAHLECAVSHAVVSVPAYFNDNQRQATRDAAQVAGLQVNRLINEPTAAAIAHGLHDSTEQQFIVLDLGGGTFDVSIIEYFDGVLEVHSSAGDSSLGGEDFTAALLNHFLKLNKIDKKTLSAVDLQLLYVRAETAKRRLRKSESPVISFHHDEQQYELVLNEAQFKSATISLLSRLRLPMSRALQDAALRADQLDDVVLVGGATRMPVFRNLVATLFGRLPRTDADPDLTIVHGVAIQAGLVGKDESLDEIVLTDVCPFSLGIETVDEGNPTSNRLVFSPILERNTIVPVSKVQTYHTIANGQDKIKVVVYQGESRWVENNLLLETIEIRVPQRPATQESIDVRFSYDVNGLLDIDIRINSTGKMINRLVDNQGSRLSESEKVKSREKLNALKILPRDREEIRVLLARADRIYSSLLDVERESVATAVSQFEQILARQNNNEIARACTEFDEFLDQFDTDIWA